MTAQRVWRGPSGESRKVTAILGPTNTGKTHFAIERMLAHRSGMIGLPLRLLAREVYEKVVRLKGAEAAALVTGEEKIVPPGARYFVCTVEAMPLDLGVACLAIDEIQLAADLERGHVFTDRLLNARGSDETMFLGAETMRGAIQRFVPEAHFITRPRFSDLAYTGAKKLTRLPRRTAIVAFSAEDVYAIAELVRRQRGGAAVVLGALSPRTRNAQVALYQNGDVDFLVATDAIGMGLNMDIDHVAFASLTKFDGVGLRSLRPDEIGQIAGRAGRHMNDGTFGVTGDCEAMDDELVTRVETHRYDPVRVLQYRNSKLAFHSLDALIASLEEPAPVRGLAKARQATDLAALRILASHADIREMACAPAAVRRLWDACQLPDFRKLSAEEHVRLAGQIYRHLMSDAGVLPEDWLARQVARLDKIEGDVATLSGRLAQIRTWTYAAHRPGWVKDASHWQAETRAVEDRLSDALHENLTQRFVDRRTAVLLRSLRDDDFLDLKLDESGGVIVGGEAVGKLDGFRFAPDPRAEGIHGRTLRAAALKALEGEFARRERRLLAAEAREITLSEHGRIWWDGAIVARLTAGADPLSPGMALEADEHLPQEMRARLREKLAHWLAAHIEERLDILAALKRAADAKAGTADALPAEARGLAYQLYEHLGSLDRRHATMPDNERAAIRALRPFGVRFARRSLFLPKLLRPEAAGLLALLWGVHHKLDRIPPPPQPGLTSFENDAALPGGFLAAAGFRILGPRAIRLDMLDRLEDELEQAAATGLSAEAAMPKLVSLLGTDRPTLEAVLTVLGWARVEVTGGDGAAVWRRTSRPPQARPGKKKAKNRGPNRGKMGRTPPRPAPDPDSPFARLKALIAAD